MAVALTGTPVHISSAIGPSSLTISATVPADAVLMVATVGQGGPPGANNVSGITFNGSATGWVKAANVYDAAFTSVDVWYVLNPTVTTANVIASFTSNPNYASLHVACFSGVDVAGTPVGTAVTNFSTAGSLSITTGAVSSAIGNIVLAACSSDANAAADLTEAGTLIFEDALGGDTVMSTQRYSGAASVSPSWTIADTQNWAAAAIDIKASGGGGNSSSVSPSVSPSSSVSASSSRSPSPSASTSPSVSLSPSPSSSVSSSASPSGGTVYIERTVIDYID